MKHYSPLRYPGGKNKLSKFMKSILKHNNLLDGMYVEPYSGGAGIALALLLENSVSEVILNDIDPAIYNFWHIVINDHTALVKLINDTPVTVKTFKEQKLVLRNIDKYRPLEIAFATFFLNRTCRSGVLNAGVIGGNDQNGNYKIDARYNKTELIKRIEFISKYASKIHLYNLDAMDLIDEIKNKFFLKKIFFYFDPPYYDKGSELYSNSYSHEDHLNISEKIKNLQFPWITTYDNVLPIRSIYTNENRLEFNLNYSVNNDKKRVGKELMFYNNITIPHHPNDRDSSSE